SRAEREQWALKFKAAAIACERRTRILMIGLAASVTLICDGFSAQDNRAAPQTPDLPKPEGNAFSISSPVQLADWQKHLTLGAGDILNISLYEQADSERKGLIIGPDGRLNYLQARDVAAAGLT